MQMDGSPAMWCWEVAKKSTKIHIKFNCLVVIMGLMSSVDTQNFSCFIDLYLGGEKGYWPNERGSGSMSNRYLYYW